MTNPVPGPRQPYSPAGGTPTSGSPTPSAPSGTYPPQGSPASYPAPTGIPVSAAHAGGPVSYAAPTGEGWSGRSLSSSEKNTQEALLALKAEIGKAVIGQDAAVTGLIVGLVAGGHALLEGVPAVKRADALSNWARPSAFCRPYPPVRRSAWAWCTTRVSPALRRLSRFWNVPSRRTATRSR